MIKQISLVFIIVACVGIYLFNKAIVQHHRVGTFSWKLPTNEVPTLSENLSLQGAELALQAESLDPSQWKPIKDRPGLLLNAHNSNAGTIMLANSRSGKRLIARVELDPSNRVMNIVISRPK